MPKVKTNRVKYPEGWELIEPTLSELQAKMREGIVTSVNKSILALVVSCVVKIIFIS